MFEIIRLILDMLTKLLDPSVLLASVKEKRKQKLGTDLFMLYILIYFPVVPFKILISKSSELS